MTDVTEEITSSSRVDALMSARSVAVVGASNKPGPGRNVVDNLDALGFAGPVHVVNTSGAAVVRGKETFESLSAIPEVPDLVVVAVNSAASIAIVSEAARIGARGAVLLASGFGEVGHEGADRAREVIAGRGNLSIVGPNCLGFLNLKDRVAAYSGPMVESPVHGVVGLVSNSGAMACTLTGAAAERGIAFSHVITTGNQIDLGVSEFVRYLAAQDEVRVIACYLEGFDDGRKLLQAFDEAAANAKTVVVLKAGRSAAGGEAARTHTGVLAGLASIQADLFSQCDVLMAADPEEFLGLIELGERLHRPTVAPRVAAVTISGGERLLLADAGEEVGLDFAELSQATLERVRSVLPPFATASNPLDTTGAGIVEGRTEAHGAAVLAVAGDPEVNLLIACQDAKNGWVERDRSSTLFLDAVRCAADASLATGTPVVVLSPTTGAVDRRARTLVRERGIPCLMGQGPGMRALAKFLRCAPECGGTRTAPSSMEASGAGGVRLDTHAVIERLAAHEIAHWPTAFPRSEEEAVRAASEAGYPVVLKLEGGLAHRKVAGGVRLGLRDAAEVAQAWRDLASVADAVGVSGFEMSLQRVAFAEAELFVGGADDEQFGPIVLFGSGGTDVEREQRCVVGLAPLTGEGASALVGRGPWRSHAPVGACSSTVRAKVERVVRAVSEIICDPSVRAIDINPLLVLRDDVAVIDAKVVVADGEPPPS